MKLIAILIALALEKWGGHLRPRRFIHGLSAWLTALVRRLGSSADGGFGVFLVLAFPVLLFALIDFALSAMFEPLAILFAAVVLFACLGGHCLKESVEALADMLERGDEEGARIQASEITGRRVSEQGDALIRVASEGLLIEANERVYGVLFWFIVLGPAGAVLYRLSGSMERVIDDAGCGLLQASNRFHWLLGWVPARLSAVGYAMAGSFGHATEHWSAHWQDNPDSNRAILISSGLGALLALEADPPQDLLGETLALVTRAVAVWAAAVALIILGS